MIARAFTDNDFSTLVKGFTSSVRPKRLNPKYFNESWRPLTLEHNGQHLLYVFMPAADPKGVIGFGHGWGSDPCAFEKERRFKNLKVQDDETMSRDIFTSMNDAGYSVVVAVLPDIHHKDHRAFIQTNKAANDHFMFNKDSPLYTLEDPSLPRSAVTHSARGLSTLQSLSERPYVDFANEHLDNIIVMNPMTGITGVSNNFIMRNVYRAYASIALPRLNVRDCVAGTTKIDQWYMGKSGIIVPDAEDRAYPTHGQIKRMSITGQQLIREFNRAGGIGQKDFNLAFILGKDDSCTSAQINVRAADIIGVNNVEIFGGQHNPLINDQRSLNYLINYIDGKKPAQIIQIDSRKQDSHEESSITPYGLDTQNLA